MKVNAIEERLRTWHEAQAGLLRELAMRHLGLGLVYAAPPKREGKPDRLRVSREEPEHLLAEDTSWLTPEATRLLRAGKKAQEPPPHQEFGTSPCGGSKCNCCGGTYVGTQRLFFATGNQDYIPVSRCA